MKPINIDDPGCTPTSSNCVIWQGPDIECIKLCKGDTVSNVVYKLATELCTIMDQLDITNYDLACLNIQGCGPKDFQELIQYLITRICDLTNCCEQGGPAGSNGCPDCIVPIAPCFYYQNQLGDTVTSMQLSDYVHAIGNRVCDLVNEITTIQQTLANHEVRITNLENAPQQTLTLPKVVPSCVVTPAVPTDMNIVLQALEQQFCQLIGATGTPNNIYQAILRECLGLGASPQLGGVGTMSSIPGWVNNIQNLADAITNIWLTICDLRAAVTNIQTNCCPTGCDGITLSLTAELNGNDLTIYTNGTIPAGFTQCAPGTTMFTVSDQSGNTINVPIDIIFYLNNISGYTFDLSASPINTADNLTITASPCLTNATTGALCQYALSFIIANQNLCIPLLFITTETTINYSGNVVAGTATYTVELWNNLGTVMLGSQAQLLTAPSVLAGVFSSLTGGTNYKIRLKITPSGGGPDVYCPFTVVTTDYPACAPPTYISGNIEFPIT